ncbi:peptide chain release factor H [Conchiformibius kuhniae]|uniref:Peptide chain release factor H n=1 Tax=Conchiformibius kuhniae TaxID=211502 RepID=A0A8T9MSQ5_9NEIS|nr:peptide chain release factor H [Conchiformibius kuhniae]
MTETVSLLVSAAQGPAECRLFARFVCQTLLREAAQAGLSAEYADQTPCRHGILSAVLTVRGTGAARAAQNWTGSWQWVCRSPLRLQHPRKNWFVGVSLLPEAVLPDTAGEVRFHTCRASGNGGQHVNKTDSAVRAVHTPTGVAVKVQNRRSQHANKQQAKRLLADKLAHLRRHAQQQADRHTHRQRHQLERGNPVRVCYGNPFTAK